MSSPVRQRGFLLSLAAEGMADLVRGCAAGAIGQGNDHAINVLGPAIVERWRSWMIDQPSGHRHAAISELADLPAPRVRSEAVSVVERVASDASAEDRALAVEYLCALPRSFQSSLVLDPTSGGRVLPAGSAPEDADVLLRLLPIDAPPYGSGAELPRTAYRVGDLIATHSGVSCRGTRENDAVVVLFPRCRGTVESLRREKARLERLRELGRGPWSERLVRLLDFDLDHATPFLISEMVSGGDLSVLLMNLREQAHRGFTPDEVLRLVEQIAEGLAYLHQNGLIHGDLKPANVIVSGEAVKLAGLGTRAKVGGVDAPGSPASRVRRWRGAERPLYTAQPLKQDSANPRDDLYSLGVLWYQLLVGDVTRRPPAEVRAELTIPQIDLLERCLGDSAQRLLDASAFLDELRSSRGRILTGEEHAASVVSPEEIRRERQRKRELLHGLREIRVHLQDWSKLRRKARRLSRADIWLALPMAGMVFVAVILLTRQPIVANLAGLAAGILFLYLRFRGRQQLARLTREMLDQEIELLAVQSPDDVQSWGGPLALRNAELLPEIIAALEEDMRVLAIQEQEEPDE